MCIIIYKPIGKVIPEKLIKRQWQINPDGAGFAVRIDEEKYPLYFKKGIMNLEELLEDEKFREFNSEDYELVLHLRKSTGGGVRPELCHPFPVLSRNRLQGYSKALLFHNGTFGLKVPKKYREKLSDTAYLAYFARRIGLVNFKLMLKCDILNRNNSRVLLWTDSGMLFKGTWHTYKGLKVSKPIVSYKSNYSSYYRSLWDYRSSYDFLEQDTDIEPEIVRLGKRKLIKLGNQGEQREVRDVISPYDVLLDDGSIWEPPEEVKDIVEIGDLIEF